MATDFDELADALRQLYGPSAVEVHAAAEPSAFETILKSATHWPAEAAALQRQQAALRAEGARLAAEATAEAPVLRARQAALHRERVRCAIPQILTKALEIQKAGGCSALDVCRIQAETNLLAAAWGL